MESLLNTYDLKYNDKARKTIKMASPNTKTNLMK